MTDAAVLPDGQVATEGSARKAVPAPPQVRKPEEADTPIRRDAAIRAMAETVNRERRTIEVVISTGTAVRRWDWAKGREYDEVLTNDPGALRLERLNGGALLLAAPNWYRLDAVIGAVEPGSARVEDGELRARIRFSKRAKVEGVFNDVLDIIGALIILLSSLYIFRREIVLGRRRREESEAGPALPVDWPRAPKRCRPSRSWRSGMICVKV